VAVNEVWFIFVFTTPFRRHAVGDGVEIIEIGLKRVFEQLLPVTRTRKAGFFGSKFDLTLFCTHVLALLLSYIYRRERQCYVGRSRSMYLAKPPKWKPLITAAWRYKVHGVET